MHLVHYAPSDVAVESLLDYTYAKQYQCTIEALPLLILREDPTSELELEFRSDVTDKQALAIFYLVGKPNLRVGTRVPILCDR